VPPPRGLRTGKLGKMYAAMIYIGRMRVRINPPPPPTSAERHTPPTRSTSAEPARDAGSPQRARRRGPRFLPPTTSFIYAGWLPYALRGAERHIGRLRQTIAGMLPVTPPRVLQLLCHIGGTMESGGRSVPLDARGPLQRRQRGCLSRRSDAFCWTSAGATVADCERIEAGAGQVPHSTVELQR